MVVIYIIILLAFSVFAVLQQLQKEKNKKIDIFEEVAIYVYEKWIMRKGKEKERILERFHMLYHKHNKEQKYYEFMIQKWKSVTKLIFLGCILSLALWIQESTKSNLLKENVIERNKVGGKKKEVTLIATIQGQEEEIFLDVEAQEYQREDLERLFMEMLTTLEKLVLGENESVDKVVSDLYLVNQVNGFPFQIEWGIDNNGIIGQSGILENEQIEEEVVVQLTARVSYKDYTQNYIFSVVVYPKVFTEKERLQQSLKNIVVNQEKDSRTTQQYILPMEVNQKQIKWREKEKNSSTILFVICVFATVLIGVGKEKELMKQVDLRNQQLLQQYPDIVSKLTLLIGAGMTLQGAIEKLVQDYDKRRKKSLKTEYAYEEFLVLCNEIKMGTSEVYAYTQLGRRCKLQSYKKLSTLLLQSLKKGTGNLVMQLEGETKLALEDRKANAKKKGEEASTKMLAPMMIMLLIVMIIIMVPAFGNFSM